MAGPDGDVGPRVQVPHQGGDVAQGVGLPAGDVVGELRRPGSAERAQDRAADVLAVHQVERLISAVRQVQRRTGRSTADQRADDLRHAEPRPVDIAQAQRDDVEVVQIGVDASELLGGHPDRGLWRARPQRRRLVDRAGVVAVNGRGGEQHDAAGDTGEARSLEHVQRALDVADDVGADVGAERVAHVDDAVDAAIADDLQQPRQVEQLAERRAGLLVAPGPRPVVGDDLLAVGGERGDDAAADRLGRSDHQHGSTHLTHPSIAVARRHVPMVGAGRVTARHPDRDVTRVIWVRPRGRSSLTRWQAGPCC